MSIVYVFILQDLDPSQFSLIEVLLDRGVAERVLERDEKPWKLIQQTRKVIYEVSIIVLIWKITTLKLVHLECLNFMHLVAFPQLRNAENLNLIC